ncbi:MAG TPA: metabolite traffic protein EboE [Vicinamibacterales bacterium]|nr:metabolite traffic protein EboE [Vicinamibacterales bacterium]
MLAGGAFHLTYCSNIHPGESWPEVRAALGATLPAVRARLQVEGPLGIGLRLSAAAAEELERAESLEEFRDFLRRGNYYVFTINGFPYGAFHGTRVKERVYLPDWRDPARIHYSDRLARILAALMDGGPDVTGTISTVPGAFRPTARRRRDADQIARGILRHAATLHAIRQQTGRTIALALEPEPACFLETIDDAVEFFRSRLFDEVFVAEAAGDMRLDLDVGLVRRHVGLCLDTCHMAVEFEDAADAFARLAGDGIMVAKVQVSSAIRIPSPAANPAALATLARFADDVYLHQVVARGAAEFTRHTDLPDALVTRATAAAGEWRVHFHVPLFMDALPPLETTQGYVRQVLALLRRNDACRYLEVETYTWDVLPPEYRTTDVGEAIARELAWVREQLEG